MWVALAAGLGLALPAALTLTGQPLHRALAQSDSEGPAPNEAGTPGARPDAADAGTEKKEPRKRRGMLVHVDRVRTEPLIQTMPVVGRLVAVRSGVVAARLDAPVAEMKVDVGDTVEKGAVLALLVDDRLKWDREEKAAEVAEARARVATAEARLALARQELDRLENLRASAAFSKARFEDKRLEVARYGTELAEAKATVERTRAALELAETQLRYTRIRAPYAGTITRRHTEAGAFIKEGQPVYTMISDRDLEIEADVPATRVVGLAPGTEVAFELGDGNTYEAAVRAVVPEEDPRTRTRMVRFTPRFPERPAGIAANQSVTLRLPVSKPRMVLSVHKDALTSSRGIPTVFVVEDGRAHARAIRIGEGVGTRFEVLAGLEAGDLVVIRGNERLRDGRRVRINGTALP